MTKIKWYVVTVGKEIGIYTSWLEVAPLVVNVPGATHQSFSKEEEARTLYQKLIKRGQTQVVGGSTGSTSPTASSNASVPSSVGSQRSSLPTPHPSPAARSQAELGEEEVSFQPDVSAGTNGSSAQNSNGSRTPTRQEMERESLQQPLIPATRSHTFSPSTTISSPATGVTYELDSQGRMVEKRGADASSSARQLATRIGIGTSLFSASSLSSPATGVTYEVDASGRQNPLEYHGSDVIPQLTGSSSIRREVTSPFGGALSPLNSPNLHTTPFPSIQTALGSDGIARAPDAEVQNPSPTTKVRAPSTLTPPESPRQRGSPTSARNTPSMSERTVPLRSSAESASPFDGESGRDSRRISRFIDHNNDSAPESDDDPVIRVSPIIDTSSLSDSCSRHAAGYKFTSHQTKTTTRDGVREIVTIIHTESPCRHIVCPSCRYPLSSFPTSLEESFGSLSVKSNKRHQNNYAPGRVENGSKIDRASPGPSSARNSPRRVEPAAGELDPRSPFSPKTANIGGFSAQFKMAGRPSPSDVGMSSLFR